MHMKRSTCYGTVMQLFVLEIKKKRKEKLRCKKVKARTKPMLITNAKPNKAPREIQYKYPSKFNPRLSSVFCPIVVFV